MKMCDHSFEIVHYKWLVKCELCGRWRLRNRHDIFWKVTSHMGLWYPSEMAHPDPETIVPQRSGIFDRPPKDTSGIGV